MKRYAITLLLLGTLLLTYGLWLALDITPVVAQDDTQQEPAPTGDNAYCTICHNTESQQMTTFADGTTHSVAVDLNTFADSVHGPSNPEGALGCVDCHSEAIFPHDDPPFANQREFRITQSNVCIDCHTEQAENLADGVHYTALFEGNLRAATCVDCHGAHNIQPPDEPRERISETCGQCHQIVFSEYAESVHGQALMEGDPNVPTCVDCHGVHGIQHPTTALFRNRSPELCAECHGDSELMQEYGISTNIFNSYLTDFHGTTVALFEQNDPNVASNKAVCYDCHGVHNILPASDENSRVIRENLLTTCRECHPDATSDFPDAWVGHYEPTFETRPILATVNLFYDIFIPVVLGAFVFLVGTDLFRLIRNFMRRK